jgi:hypothetical protein
MNNTQSTRPTQAKSIPHERAAMSDREATQPQSETLKVRDKRGGPIFIHSELDDYGLTLIEFRVYARLARRAGDSEAFESVPNMARDFGVNDRTVQRALKLLISARLISAAPRPGFTTRYSLLPLKDWRPPGDLSALRAEIVKPKQAEGRARVVTPEPGVGGDTRAGVVVTPEPGVVVTPEPDEGSPSEGTPLKVLPHTPRASATAPVPRSASAGVGVPASRSRYSFELRKAYASAKGLGGGWLRNSRDGRYDDDEQLVEWMNERTPAAVERALREPERPHLPLGRALQHVGSILNFDPTADVAEALSHLDVSEETRAYVLNYDFPQRQAAGLKPGADREPDRAPVRHLRPVAAPPAPVT